MKEIISSYTEIFKYQISYFINSYGYTIIAATFGYIMLHVQTTKVTVFQ